MDKIKIFTPYITHDQNTILITGTIKEPIIASITVVPASIQAQEKAWEWLKQTYVKNTEFRLPNPIIAVLDDDGIIIDLLEKECD